MTSVLAHQGGWDEILLPALAVLGLLWYSKNRRRAGTPDAPAGATGTCRYCGAVLPEDARRCPTCGFRVENG